MGDGTVRDNDSWLIWLKNANCSERAGVEENGTADWGVARSAAAALSDGTCGLTDGSAAGEWRLPNNNEWVAFMSQKYYGPALVNTVGDHQWSEGDAFNGVQDDEYWSLTEDRLTPQYFAYIASVWHGVLGTEGVLKELHNYVWPIRSGINRFTDMGDGTIRDNNSQRIWLKDANCFGTQDWDDARFMADALAHGQCSLEDGSSAGQWRLPTKAEWEAFVSPPPDGYTDPALVNTVGNAQWSEGDAFRNVQSEQYWSNEEVYPDIATIMDMGSGVPGEEREYSPTWPTYVWPIKK